MIEGQTSLWKQGRYRVLKGVCEGRASRAVRERRAAARKGGCGEHRAVRRQDVAKGCRITRSSAAVLARPDQGDPCSGGTSTACPGALASGGDGSRNAPGVSDGRWRHNIS